MLLATLAIFVIAAVVALMVWVVPLATSGVGAEDAISKASAGSAIIHDDAGNLPTDAERAAFYQMRQGAVKNTGIMRASMVKDMGQMKGTVSKDTNSMRSSVSKNTGIMRASMVKNNTGMQSDTSKKFGTIASTVGKKSTESKTSVTECSGL
ncbi:MAG TPA: hypothetical protein VHH32_04155 [Gemmatimonadales bacterium]|nr:hypothetical protein [Gemmatimonadales bacterium]